MLRHGTRRRECGAPSVLAEGQNLDAGAIHLPRADEITGVPARRKPGGAAHAAQNAEALFMPNIHALNFVMYAALGGGVTRSLSVDMHGKGLSSYLLDMEL